MPKVYWLSRNSHGYHPSLEDEADWLEWLATAQGIDEDAAMEEEMAEMADHERYWSRD